MDPDEVMNIGYKIEDIVRTIRDLVTSPLCRHFPAPPIELAHGYLLRVLPAAIGREKWKAFVAARMFGITGTAPENDNCGFKLQVQRCAHNCGVEGVDRLVLNIVVAAVMRNFDIRIVHVTPTREIQVLVLSSFENIFRQLGLSVAANYEKCTIQGPFHADWDGIERTVLPPAITAASIETAEEIVQTSSYPDVVVVDRHCVLGKKEAAWNVRFCSSDSLPCLKDPVKFFV
jgi:hypothetical protein